MAASHSPYPSILANMVLHVGSMPHPDFAPQQRFEVPLLQDERECRTKIHTGNALPTHARMDVR